MWLGQNVVCSGQRNDAQPGSWSRGWTTYGLALSLLCLGLTAPATSLTAEVTPISERVAAHLAAGEFGPALALAQQSPADRDQLLALVAEAQLGAGEVAGARSTSRRMANPAGPQMAQRGNAPAGGGSYANPYPLILMIQQLTGGADAGSPWMDIDGEGGAISWENNGVMVDPQGVLQLLTSSEQTGRLTNLGMQARSATLNRDMAQASELRFVSLARLERAVAERLVNGQPVLETMRHLAGLSRIQYVIAVPEENDVLIAGPAEGWKFNEQGVAVGSLNGRPTMQLDDFVTVLRAFGPGGEGIFGCSINPRTENLKATQEFVLASQAAGPLTPQAKSAFFKGIQKRMGQQDIVVYGVPQNSRVAKVLVAADYRMKLIGIGKLEGGPAIPSIFELFPQYAKSGPQPLDALRWWLTMKYDAIQHSPDRQVYEIRGSSVLVQSEDQFVAANGQRQQTGKASPVNQAFAKKFTENYSELAKRDLVFAELQNVFDLGMVAALVQSQKVGARAGWEQGTFAASGGYRPAAVQTAKAVESVLNHKTYSGKDLIVQVAGGVRGDLMSVVRDQQQAAAGLQQVEARAKTSRLPSGRWWWDAAASK